ncbi:MAG: hypothetical protein LBI79_08455 [Nitrososphaerota archaeon]|jgi:ATP-dependent DNA helicase RecG|nr:hypothetical protein [Nitrososphaerota archaeon]
MRSFFNFCAIFFRCSLRSIDKINRGCAEYGQEIPSYETKGNEFKVIFKNTFYIENVQTTIKHKKNVGVNVGVKKTEQAIITLIAENPYITQEEMKIKIGVELRTIE